MHQNTSCFYQQVQNSWNLIRLWINYEKLRLNISPLVDTDRKQVLSEGEFSNPAIIAFSPHCSWYGREHIIKGPHQGAKSFSYVLSSQRHTCFLLASSSSSRLFLSSSCCLRRISSCCLRSSSCLFRSSSSLFALISASLLSCSSWMMKGNFHWQE